MADLIIVGAGGFGLEVAAYAEDMVRAGKADFRIKGFLDDTKEAESMHGGYPVLGDTNMIEPSALYVIAVGAPETRRKLAQKLEALNAQFIRIIHPQSYVAKSARIGAGTVIAPFAFVGPEAQIGRHCLLNVHATVGHECTLGDWSVLSPYAEIQGASDVAERVFMGAHACVTAQKHVGADARISAGAVVYSNVPDGAQALGNPAAFRK